MAELPEVIMDVKPSVRQYYWAELPEVSPGKLMDRSVAEWPKVSPEKLKAR